ncbi:hypothetical protein M5X11_09175 [Paenibacillus alginolyticus]|uniref:hypothetical protein n=1 Tax=Paenibacillus alginolyticus TaxID=59839 RepID=UPI0004013B2E|nr:hypothetical protein [Paenibacillus alginolyticus]MCY9665129.1 hypothetical protein [Paenibacillus alginolyticus]
MTQFQQLTESESIRKIITGIGFTYNTNELIQKHVIYSEYIRSALNQLSSSVSNGSKKFEPIYITRLINTVSNHLEGVFPDIKKHTSTIQLNDDYSEIEKEKHGLIRLILANLQLIGDCSSLGKGYWLPSPIRLVQIPRSEVCAIIGSLSYKEIKRLFPDAEVTGLGRIVTKEYIPENIKSDYNMWQEFDAWLGWVPNDIIKWIKDECNNVSKSGSVSSSTFRDFEVYISNDCFLYNTRQNWIQYESFSAFGISESVMLCRTLSKPRRYFLGVFNRGVLKKEKSVENFEKIRWIANALKMLHNSLLSAEWKGNILKVYPALPASLDRYVSLFSYRIPMKNRFPQYFIAKKYRTYIDSFLSKYGYSILDRGDILHEAK